MASTETFVQSPSEELLNSCTKDQLLQLVEHYGVDIGDRKLKDEIKLCLRSVLVHSGILPGKSTSVNELNESPLDTLTFEQKRELLMLEMEKERLAMDQMRISLERERFQFEKEKLKSISVGSTRKEFDLVSNLRLVPKFEESDPDTFFSLFERIANSRGWPDEDRVVMLQSVFTGKAQAAYSALSEHESRVYKTVKESVLKAYELVPEAYRQRFRSWRKAERQSHVEFVSDLSRHFQKWCLALNVETFEDLCDLVVFEQFVDCVPPEVATHIIERGVKSVSEAAIIADEYVFAHKGKNRSFPIDFVSAKSLGNAKFNKFDSSRPSKSTDSDQRCNYCHAKGHWKSECNLLRNKSGHFSAKNVKPAVFTALAKKKQSLGPVSKAKDYSGFEAFVSDGFVSLGADGKKVPVKILRDTGATDSFIHASVLPFSDKTDTGDCIIVKGVSLVPLSASLHKVFLSCGLVEGDVHIAVRPALPIEGIDVILGNDLAGNHVWATRCPVKVSAQAKEPDDCELNFPDVFTACAVTRAAAKAKSDKSTENGDFKVQIDLPKSFSISQQELISEQKADSSLSDLFDQVQPSSEIQNSASGYFLQDEVLVRKWVPQGFDVLGNPVFQIIVPTKFREKVLSCSHDQTGHLGVKKTYNHILRYFFWPRLKRDVATHIKTCHTCQVTGKPNQTIKPAPLRPIPAIENPFEHLIIDCVGPLPKSKSGSQYLLTVMCLVTRYPAAYALRNITAKSIVKALTQFIAIFGIPKVVQSDQGSNFSSHLFAQVMEQLGIKHNQASAYHAQSQGALERFHQTLKSLLRSYCAELDKDWEEGLPWLLLAAREVCQESTGFSPNDLVFGHKVRGPLAVLHDNLPTKKPPDNLLDYVNGFRHRLYKAGQLAKQNLAKAQTKMKTVYDRHSAKRQFSEGDQVLALLPIVGSPFQAKFHGPYTVVKQLSELNYLIATPDRRKRQQLCHINLLKPYFVRESLQCTAKTLVSGTVLTACEAQESSLHGGEEVAMPDEAVLCGRLKNSETLQKLDTLFSHLSRDKAKQLVSLIGDFSSLFGDTPSQTNLIQHDIDVGDSKPIRQRFFRVSREKQSVIDKEVKYLLDNKLAVPSCSSWASPCLIVQKSDKSPRMCTDFRKVNAVTKPDSYPLPRVEDCVDQVGSAKFVSKLDLLKGYWQVPLTPRAQEISAFITPSGLFSYTVMGFGLRNAPATFQRLMNQLVNGLEGCAVYLDDVVVYSNTWDDHLIKIRALFDRLAQGNLTLNLAKCDFAKATVTYLGKIVGQGQVRPVMAKVAAVSQFPAPTTKKELMRFLGLVGYYRSFCRNFSTVVAPLTNLLRAKAKFIWDASCQKAFEEVKALLCSAPVLLAPQFDQPFKLHVDASQVGAGAVLLQTDSNKIDRPVSFFSRKFNSFQLNYSVIEKEALALILALQHFQVYLDSGTPITVYSDHNPLTFLNSLQNPNQRLMRWALFLQPYNLSILHIKGKDNVLADALSRAPL